MTTTKLTKVQQGIVDKLADGHTIHATTREAWLVWVDGSWDGDIRLATLHSLIEKGVVERTGTKPLGIAVYTLSAA